MVLVLTGEWATDKDQAGDASHDVDGVGAIDAPGGGGETTAGRTGEGVGVGAMLPSHGEGALLAAIAFLQRL